MSLFHMSDVSMQGLPEHCTPTSPFLVHVSTFFGSCLPTPLALVSTLLGTLSIVSWLFAQLPQIYKNYQIKSTAGLSVFFLTEWLLGDATNLLGALFTKQATWQVIIASYYVFVDLCLVVQYFWYTHFKPAWAEGSLHSAGSSIDGDAGSDMINSLSPINSTFIEEVDNVYKDNQANMSQSHHTQPGDGPRFAPISYEKNRESSPDATGQPNTFSQTWWTGPSPRTVLHAAALSSMLTQAAAAPVNSADQAGLSVLNIFARESAIEVVGVILSWCSTCLYLASRLPQLYKNWQRQSTAGLSPLLFIAAFCGNFFYSSSMLTNPNAWYSFGPYGGHGWADASGSSREEWVLNATPFFLGAFGVLGLDASMGIQFLMYGEQDEKVVKVKDGQGRSSWRRVNGWMRGWIPAVAKERVVDLAESQRLLSHSRGLERRSSDHSYGGL